MSAENVGVVLGVDVGGTFTDLAQWDGKSITVGKTPSTPEDQSVGVVACSKKVVPDGAEAKLVHGTTVATNALLERRGAKTLLITDAGFEGVIEIGRQNRPSLYDAAERRPDPLVEVKHRLGLEQGITEDALNAAVDGIVKHVEEFDVEAIAICLLYSYSDSETEQVLASKLRSQLLIPVSVSHEVVGEFREYERMSTTVLNAFLAPEVEFYMTNLKTRSAESPITKEISVMASSGGLMSLDSASRLSSSIVLSGPAGGVVATTALGRALGATTLISFDMGGTSSDVCRIDDGRPEVAYRRTIEGHAIMMASVAVHTVGAGGGSIAWADNGGALRVGPRSAGANPGPVCYGHAGTEPTVTDANLVLGRLDPRGLPGGISLHLAAALAAFETLGKKLGLNALETAQGVVDVVESHMTRAVRTVSIEQGADPRESVLVAYGGAGGLHATALGRELGVLSVIVPPFSGVFSAFGLLLSAPRVDVAHTVNLDESRASDLTRLAFDLMTVSKNRLLEDSGGEAETVEMVVDMRYVGQSHETSVLYQESDSWDDLVERFTELHVRQNGFSQADSAVEGVTIRAAASGRPAFTWSELPEFVPAGESRRGDREIMVDGKTQTASIWSRQGLAVGSVVEGPAIIEENESTIYVGRGEQATVHETGALKISW